MAPEVIPFAAEETEIGGLWRLRMKQITDERGTIREFYRESAFVEAGVPSLGPWVQVNVTETRPGAVRGMHSEHMVKLVAVVSGTAFGAYVDVRPESPTRGKLVTIALDAGTQVLVPRGVANGFQSTSNEATQYLYCFDVEWTPGMAGAAVHPLDPDLAIPWPLPIDETDPAQLSAKDASLPRFADL